MVVSALGFVIFLGSAIPLIRWLSFSGIALANAIAYSVQGLLLFLILNHQLPDKFRLAGPFLRGGLSALLAGLSIWLVMYVLPIPISALGLALVAIVVSTLAGVAPIWKEIRLLVHL
jgi:peptidoglycan biosynthesis protein MviN/MurJ (putative lipid II flippase)